MNNRPETYVFLHIGKTAGSSVRNAIGSVFPPSAVCPLVHSAQIVDLSEQEKHNYQLFSAHIGFDLARELATDATNVFTLLRDPVERVISLYYYWREVESQSENIGVDLARNQTIDEFLDSTRGAVVMNARNTQTWQLAFDHEGTTRKSIRSKYSDDQIFQRALDNIEQMGVVGVQENIEQFRRNLCKTYGWDLPIFEKKNITAQRRKRESLPIASRKKIQSINSMDIELYAYVLKHFVMN